MRLCEIPPGCFWPHAGRLEVACIELARSHVQSILRASSEHAQTMFSLLMRTAEALFAADGNTHQQTAEAYSGHQTRAVARKEIWERSRASRSSQQTASIQKNERRITRKKRKHMFPSKQLETRSTRGLVRAALQFDQYSHRVVARIW